MNAWIVALAVVAVIVVLVACFVVVEERKDRAWADGMSRMADECPACKPWGGWYLGAMREDGSFETHACGVCRGTGSLSEGRALAVAESGAIQNSDGGAS